jgi:hypothetical protein
LQAFVDDELYISGESGPDDPTSAAIDSSRRKLLTAANELELCGAALDKRADDFVETIFNTRIRSKLMAYLNDIFARSPARASAMVDEKDKSSDLQIPRLSSFMHFVQKTLLPIIEDAGPLEEAKHMIVLVLVKEFASHFERWIFALAKHPEIALPMHDLDALPSEFRKLSNYLSDLTALQAKELLLRSSQALQLLTCSSRDDRPSVDTILLTDEEIQYLRNFRQ